MHRRHYFPGRIILETNQKSFGTCYFRVETQMENWIVGKLAIFYDIFLIFPIDRDSDKTWVLSTSNTILKKFLKTESWYFNIFF